MTEKQAAAGTANLIPAMHSAEAAIAMLMEVIELTPVQHLPSQWLDAHRAGRQARKDLEAVL